MTDTGQAAQKLDEMADQDGTRVTVETPDGQTAAFGGAKTEGGVAELSESAKSATGQRLRSFIERVERLEEDKAGIAADIKEVYGEAKAQGFDVKTLKKIVSLRKKDPDDRAEEEALLETYMAELGMR